MESIHQSLRLTETESGLALLLTSKRQFIDEECQRFVEIGDVEALHDLRVAIRRLHSLFVAFAPAINTSNSLSQALHMLLKSTNHARDLEVTLAILDHNQLQLPWLQEQWQQELSIEYQHLRQHLPSTWQTLSPELEHPGQLLRLDMELQQLSLGTFTDKLLQHKLKKLFKRHKHVCRKWQDRPAHKLRISGKQIRYLIEPFADETDRCRKAVAALKLFQDMLGDYHDTVVLRGKLKQLQENADPARLSQLKQARKHLKATLKSLRKTFHKQYCTNKGNELHKSLTQAGSSLAKN